MLDDALGQPGVETEIEDILGEEILLPAMTTAVGHTVNLTASDRNAGSLPNQIKSWAQRCQVDLRGGWKASVARHLVSEWAEQATRLPDHVLDRAARLFTAVEQCFRRMA